MITMFRTVATARKTASRLIADFRVRTCLAPTRIARLDSQIPIGIRTRPRAKAIGRMMKDKIPMYGLPAWPRTWLGSVRSQRMPRRWLVALRPL